MNPCLELLMLVKQAIEKGQTVRQGLQNYLNQSKSSFRAEVLCWQRLYEQGKSTAAHLTKIESPHRRNLLQLIERGFSGSSIYQNLMSLEAEIIDACHDDLASKTAKLPIIMLIPLLLFIFPAFLMLLFGPLLDSFLMQLGGT